MLSQRLITSTRASSISWRGDMDRELRSHPPVLRTDRQGVREGRKQNRGSVGASTAPLGDFARTPAVLDRRYARPVMPEIGTWHVGALECCCYVALTLLTILGGRNDRILKEGIAGWAAWGGRCRGFSC